MIKVLNTFYHSTSTIQEHAKKCTNLDGGSQEKKKES